jgi:hypothetical protein
MIIGQGIGNRVKYLPELQKLKIKTLKNQSNYPVKNIR